MRVTVNSFLELAQTAPILDVRSPGEYKQGHIPGAVSFPLFSDEERAEVGTIYKQVSPDAAVKRGLELVEPKMQEMYAQGLSLAQDNRLLVHCWRGGKRSESVAWMLSLSGKEVKVLEGGYKAFRNFVLSEFEKPRKLWVIGGLTGSGKTEVLHHLASMEERTVDLEEMANHRGSAFGGLGMDEEVTQAQFENELGVRLWELGTEKPMWVEDESRGIGAIVQPAGFWQSHQAGKLFFLDFPKKVRVERLLEDYGHLDAELLKDSIIRIEKRLGGLATRKVLTAFDQGDSEQVVSLLLDYYDRNYLHLVNSRPKEKIVHMSFPAFDVDEIAEALIAAGRVQH